MKKIFIGIMAIVAMVATSCQQEMDLNVKNDATATVTFNVGATGTRAYSDGLSATVLEYAVYEGATELTDLTVSLAKGNTVTMVDGKAEINLQLVTGNEYTILLWAAAQNAPYSVDWATGTMTVDYTAAVCNDENRDAFFKRYTFTVKGKQTETIELKRPFAQLNIGTDDYAAAKSAGYEPKYSQVTVENVYNTLNLWDGTVSGEEKVVYAWNDIKPNEIFPVDDATYDYVAMNYLLVAPEETTITVDFEYSETKANDKKRTVGSVPVKRNYRTNLFGQLLTSNVGINVVINPIYDEPATNIEMTVVNSVEELGLVLANAKPGSTVVLSNQITGAVTLGEAKDVTIDAELTDAVRFVTDANTKIENVTLKNIDFQFATQTGQAGACIVISELAQIDNLVIENCDLVGDNNKNSYGITGENPYASIVVKNCTFSDMGYAIQTITKGGYKSLVVEGCTFENIISWAIMPQYGYTGDLTVNSCTFANCDGLVKTGTISGIFTFTNNTLTNTNGHDGKDSKCFEVNANGTAVVNGNTKDGVNWTPGAAQGLN